MFVCEVCGKEFEKKKSMTNHRRWHSLPKYSKFQKKYSSYLIEKNTGRITSDETKIKISLAQVVHHINGIKTDNRIENLKLFADVVEHLRFHKLNVGVEN